MKSWKNIYTRTRFKEITIGAKPWSTLVNLLDQMEKFTRKSGRLQQKRGYDLQRYVGLKSHTLNGLNQNRKYWKYSKRPIPELESHGNRQSFSMPVIFDHCSASVVFICFSCPITSQAMGRRFNKNMCVG